MLFNSKIFSGKIRRTLVTAALACGLTTVAAVPRSVARADGPPSSGPSSAPASGPSVEDFLSAVHEEFRQIDQVMGGLTPEEKTKLDALEKDLENTVRADPSKLQNDRFQRSLLSQVRSALNAEHQKKFDEMLDRSHKVSLRVATSANLRMIGLNCLLYANDHDGKYAPDLGTLANEVPSPSIFLLAGSKTPLPANWPKLDAKVKADWVNQHTDFVYLAGGQAGAPAADFIVAYINPEVFPEGNIFLMGDGSVRDKPADQAKVIVAEIKGGKNPAPSMKAE